MATMPSTGDYYTTSGAATHEVLVPELDISMLNSTLGPWSEEEQWPCFGFTMMCCVHSVPEAPQLLKAIQLSKTSVRLTWATPDNTRGRILEYQVNYFGYKVY